MTAKDDPLLPRLLLTVSDAATVLGVGRSKMWELIHGGRVEVVKVDGERSTRVVYESLVAYVNRLREAS